MYKQIQCAGCGAFGGDDVTLDPAAMWSMQLAAAKDNAVGVQWAKKLQAALNQAGAKLVVDGSYGPASGKAWKAFAAEHSLSTSGDRPTGVGDYSVLCDALGGGCTLSAVKIVDGQVVPGVSVKAAVDKASGKNGPAKVGLSGGVKVGIALGAVALIAVAGISVYEVKKHKKAKASSSAGAK